MDDLHDNGPRGRGKNEPKRSGVGTTLEDLGDFCLASGEFATAIEYFNQILSMNGVSALSGPRRAGLLRKLASCYLKIGKCDHALELLDKAFMLVSDDEDCLELARVIAERGWVHFKLGEYDLSQADLEAGLDILLGEERGPDIASIYNRLGGVYLRKGEVEMALDFYRSGLSAARLVNNRELIGACLNNMGLCCKNLGRWAESRAYLEEALEIAQEVGLHLEKGIRLNNLGLIHSKLGDWKKALRYWLEAKDILIRIGNNWDLISVYQSLGHYYLTYRDFTRAEEYYIRAMKESSDNGDMRTSALSFEFLGDVHFACHRLDSAHRCYLEALEIAEQIAPEGDIVAEAKRRLADVELRRGNLDASQALAAEAVRVAADSKDVFEEACAVRSKACAEFRIGEWEQSRVGFARALELLASIGERKELAITYLRAGELLATQPSSRGQARAYLSKAMEILDSLDMHYEAGMAALELGKLAAERGDIAECHDLLGRISGSFDGEVPGEFRDEMVTIERNADDRLSRLSVSEESDLASFNSIVDRILRTDDERTRLTIILEACLVETSADRGLILVREEKTLTPLAWRNIDESDIAAMVPAVEELCTIAESAKRPLVSANVRRDARLGAGRAGEVMEGAALCVPLVLSGFGNGCICLDIERPGRFFSRGDVEFVYALTGILKSLASEQKVDRLLEETRFLRSKLQTMRRFQGIIAQNRKMLEILDAVKFLCRTTTSVLIHGETGTGKELLARAVHLSCDRSEHPFVTIDCSALSNELLESELFGHMKGAFTDAKSDKIGLFESAEGGTVFLDEIDKTSRKFQERLLQVVDKREFKPVGSTAPRKLDFRLICATNKDLSAEVAAGNFLEDLYYRLKVISLRLPPLRERRDDIPLLAEHFLEIYSQKMDRTVAGFAASAMDLLVSYSWPGNVRQLEHEIERAVTFVREGELVTPDLFSEELREWGSIVATDGPKPMAEAIQQLERQMIKDAMRKFSGNKTRAAKSLGLSRRGLLNKIQRYNLEA
jgi:transcriptional regulator with GAF, ATPase, and Fis domain/tetratricopeptide (TPR) repeat protein